jgi:hypothetical protein
MSSGSVRAGQAPQDRRHEDLDDWLTILIDFWGPVSNFGIPIAAIADMSKDPEMYVLRPALTPAPQAQPSPHHHNPSSRTHAHTHTRHRQPQD